MGIHARTRFKASNIFCRSTERSRTRGNFFIGCSVTGCSSRSIRAEQACRTLPLTFMVQEPQTSSRQARSEEHTSELQSQFHLVCRLLLEKKKKKKEEKINKNKKKTTKNKT